MFSKRLLLLGRVDVAHHRFSFQKISKPNEIKQIFFPSSGYEVIETNAKHLKLQTKIRHYWTPSFKRKPQYSTVFFFFQFILFVTCFFTSNKVSDEDLNFFKSVVGEGGVITEPSEVEIFNIDWMRKYRGNSTLVLRPKTTEQMSKVLAHCNQRKLAVVPQGKTKTTTRFEVTNLLLS